MNLRTGTRVVVLRTSGNNRRQLHKLARWVRALIPAAVLVVMPLDGSSTEVSDDAITLDADQVTSGPLSLADAIARAAAGRSERG